ncbi:hypothetical protein [Stenotrophomonas rhizophila]|uniref:hypothetical protein n=1 Tax=Stenotrophomonas rhizophila TaxID=216778 RepID=UPI001E617DC7|nr:hypothetical protein [Stenotrophomonas rhizophila]MCC7634644.1 hypothetical protein [Stenotrophomonas rhizophila]MCC7664087.1 hypothetical protein [Stenotrophomonas rhizophila]
MRIQATGQAVPVVRMRILNNGRNPCAARVARCRQGAAAESGKEILPIRYVLTRVMRYLSAPCLCKTAAGMETGAPILINNTREAC